MLIPIDEYAKNNNTSKATVYRAIREGEITAVKINRYRYIDDAQKMHTVRKKETHGHTKERLYSIWSNMKTRCYNEKTPRYYQYGGRGITICDEWRDSFMAFREWALPHGYSDDLQIDRIDCDGNYCPENCRWVTPKENTQNRRPYKTTVRDCDKHELPPPDGCYVISRTPFWRLTDPYVTIFEGGGKYHNIYPDGRVIYFTPGCECGRVAYRDA